VNISNSVKNEWSTKESIELMEIFPVSNYGLLAFTLNTIIFIAFFYFLATQDKPISELIASIRHYVTENPKHKRNVMIGIAAVILLLVYLVIELLIDPLSFPELVTSISYRGGIGLILLWIVLQPILVFSGLLLTFDMIAKDFPRPFDGYNKFSVTSFILTSVLVFIIVSIFSIVFDVNFGESPEEGIPFIPLNSAQNIFYNPSGMTFMVMGLVTSTLIIIGIVFYEFYMKGRKGQSESQQRRMANFLFLFPFIIIFVILKAFPAAFAFSLGLTTLNNLLDLLGLILVMFFAIFRVLSLKEESEEVIINRTTLLSPKNWLSLIPPYSKVLALFYLGFTSFYLSMEINTIFSLSNAFSMFEQIQMYSFIGVSFIAIIYVFWKYTPFEQEISEN
jgi:hypothetical protein